MDAVLHRYGGSAAFLDGWLWDEAVSYIDSLLDRMTQEEKRLRWYIRYEDQFPEFAAFDKATKPVCQPVRSVRDICDDAQKLMGLKWKEVPDGKWD